MRSDTEIKQQLIAILTAMADADPASEEMPQTFEAATSGGMFDFNVDISGPVRIDDPAEIEALVERALQQMADQIRPQLTAVISFMASLFFGLAREAKLACPDLDVADFLRERALELAAGD